MDIDLKQFIPFLGWFSSGVGVVAWFIFISNLVRNLKETGKVTWASWQVQLFVLGLSLSLPVLAAILLIAVPAETLARFQPFWEITYSLGYAYIVQQGYYRLTKPPSAG